MSGFASSPFATTPYGTGTPAVAVAPPSERAKGARYLNPSTRDYELDDEGEYRRMPSVRQQILLAVSTTLGSSAVERGQGIRLPGKITPNLEREVSAFVTQATQHITSAGRATVDDVTAEVLQTGRIEITVAYTDLTTDDNGVVII